MSALVIGGLAAIGAVAYLAIEKHKASATGFNPSGSPLPSNLVGGDPASDTNAGPMSYPDTTSTNSDGDTVDTGGLLDPSPVGTPGPANEPETPASGTGGVRTGTIGPSGTTATGPATGPTPTIRYVPMSEFATGNVGGVMGKNATSQAWSTYGPQIGAIW